MLSHSYMWRETLKPQHFWLTKWKQVRWIKRLFGLTPTPSNANHLLEEWMQSLEDSHVNHSQLQEEEKEQKTNDGYGKTSRDWLARYDQESCSWKMSQVSFVEESNLSLENFPRWGMMQDGLLYELTKSDHLTDENEFLSWPTPDTMPEAPNSSANVKVRPSSLGEAALWQTPATTQYATRSNGTLLLKGQAENWRTPMARDWKGKASKSHPMLPDQAEDLTNFHQVSQTHDGKTSSEKDQTLPHPYRLNPLFVQWLMGWDEGWLDLQNLNS